MERERLRFAVTQAYRQLVDHALAVGDYPAGIRVAGAWLALDSLDEEAHSRMMRLLACSGQRVAALAKIRTLRAQMQSSSTHLASTFLYGPNTGLTRSLFCLYVGFSLSASILRTVLRDRPVSRATWRWLFPSTSTA